MGDRKFQEMLDMYILDYMTKNNMRDTAAIFAKEANVCLEPVALKSREGYLAEWWGFFWDVYSDRVSKHPEAMEGSSSKVSTHDGHQDSFPFNFPATQNAENWSQNTLLALPKPDTNPTTMGILPGLQDSFPNICQATQNAGNWSQETVHSTAMPSPDMEDSQQSTLTTAISSPGMENLLQSGLPTTTPRPNLNPNDFESPSSLETDVVEGDLSTDSNK